MATYRELMSRLDLLLGSPHVNAPDEPTRWEHMRIVIQQITNVALDADPAWITASTTLTVQDQQDIYQIVANDFGKPLLIETSDPTDPYHVARQIQMCSWASEDMVSAVAGNTPVRVGGFGGYQHTAQAMAFRREPGIVYVRVLPTPSASAIYKIYYETATPNDSSLDNQPFMPYVNSYIVTATALAVLPECKWSDLDAQGNKDKRAEKRAILGPMALQMERETRRMLLTDRQQQKTSMAGFDDPSYFNDQNG